VILTLIGAVLFMDTAVGQKRYVEEDEEVDPSLALNRAKKEGNDFFDSSKEDIEKRAVRSKQAPLLHTFRGTTKPISGGDQWKERGTATLWYDAEDKLISVEVKNNDAENLQ